MEPKHDEEIGETVFHVVIFILGLAAMIGFAMLE